MPASPSLISFTDGPKHASPSLTRGGSRMRESRTYGSVRGALSNERPYRDIGGATRTTAPARAMTLRGRDSRCAPRAGLRSRELLVQEHVIRRIGRAVQRAGLVAGALVL